MIIKIEVENFRSIKETSVDLSESNVLIGVNGAGKSTLIEALNFIKEVVRGNTISRVARHYAPFGHHFFNFYTDKMFAKFSIHIQTKEDEKFVYSFVIGFNPADETGEEFYVSSEKLLKQTDSKETTIFNRAPQSNAISFDSKGNLTPDLPIKIETSRLVLATISEPEVKKVVETITSYEVIWFDEKFGRQSIQKLIVDDPTRLETIDDIAVSLRNKNDGRFEEAIETIKKVIPEFQKPEIVDLSESLVPANEASGNNSKTSSSRKEQKSHRYFVNWSDSRYPSTFARFSISGGNLRVIYLILSLYNVESKSCFIAEEVENGMHPGRMLKVVQILLQIAKKRRIQLIFSTHNYALTSEVLPRDIIFCQYIEGEGSTYRRLTDTDEYNTIKKALESEPSTEDVLKSGLLFRG